MVWTRWAIGMALVAVPVMAAVAAEAVDLAGAEVVFATDDPVVANAARVLTEEIEKRTGSMRASSGTRPRITLAVANDGAPGPEGYRVDIEPEGPVVSIVGADPRGVLFGVGHVLRKMEWAKNRLRLPLDAAIETAPAYAIRGHQLGYRDRANTYDKWTPEQYEQYIRELAIFGANCVENIPFEGGAESVHMGLSREAMNTHMSTVCKQYGLDFWMWIPATFDLTDEALRAASLEQHELIYRTAPLVTGVFFPGSDPGDNHPKEVMPFLVDVAKILKQYHPDAMVWLSLQGYNREKVEYVIEWIKANDPSDWLGGLVGGPSSPPLDLTRAALPPQYGLRDYPDITHTVRCQYPLAYWDPAYARTHTREPINVQPRYQQYIHSQTAPYTDGFLAYSDGAHDDVNKAVWSQLAWNPETGLREILEDYARFFLNADHAPLLADGLFGFERNWDGDLATNGSVSAMAALWSNYEDAALSTEGGMAPNWRLQMFVLRAYLDAYTRLRMLYEDELEAEANAAILAALDEGSAKAVADAQAVLARADDQPEMLAELRGSIERLCTALWESIGFQTSVPKYQANAGHRGSVLDYLDVPLNDRWWLEDEFKKVEELASEAERTARLRELATWETPGPGSYYDDLGHIGRSPHVVFPEAANTLPSLQRQPDQTFWAHNGGFSRLRQAWLVTLRWPYKLRYDQLEPGATYTLRLTGMGEAKPRADGTLLKATTYGTDEGAIKEFPIPATAIADGVVEITFDNFDESDKNWRVQSRLSEAWLLKAGGA